MDLHRVTARLDVHDADLSGSRFNDANLSGSSFNQINVSGARFNNSNMTGWRVNDAKLSGVVPKNCRLTRVTIDGVPLEEMMAASGGRSGDDGAAGT